MKDYILIQEYNLPDFEETVTDLLNDGYDFVGNLQIIPDPDGDGILYYQGMIKNLPEEKPTIEYNLRDEPFGI